MNVRRCRVWSAPAPITETAHSRPSARPAADPRRTRATGRRRPVPTRPGTSQAAAIRARASGARATRATRAPAVRRIGAASEEAGPLQPVDQAGGGLAADGGSSAVAEGHLAVERSLAAGPITTTVLRPGAFASNAAAWAWPIRSGRPVSPPYPQAHTAPIHQDDIADCAAAVLRDPAFAGRTYEPTGPASVTFAEQAPTIAGVTGLDVRAAHVTRDAWKAEVAGHLPDGFADALPGLWAASDGVPAPTTGAVLRLTGRPAYTFETWVRGHADRFSPATGRS